MRAPLATTNHSAHWRLNPHLEVTPGLRMPVRTRSYRTKIGIHSLETGRTPRAYRALTGAISLRVSLGFLGGHHVHSAIPPRPKSRLTRCRRNRGAEHRRTLGIPARCNPVTGMSTKNYKRGLVLLLMPMTAALLSVILVLVNEDAWMPKFVTITILGIIVLMILITIGRLIRLKRHSSETHDS